MSVQEKANFVIFYLLCLLNYICVIIHQPNSINISLTIKPIPKLQQHQILCLILHKIMSISLISDSQKDFITSSIRNDFRIDGRSNSQPQKYITKINNLDHLLGSSLVSIQTGQNEVHLYTGIKMRVEKLPAVKKDTSLQVKAKHIKQRVAFELGCIKKLSEQQEQTRIYIEEYLQKYIIDRHLSQFSTLLSIPQTKRHCLSISIEAYILSTPHISYLQYLHLCVKSALQNMKMPEFNVAYNQITDEETVDVALIEEDKRKDRAQRNNQQNYKGTEELKIVGVLGQNYVLGMTVEEYEAVDSCLLVAFDNEKKVLSFETLKGTTKVEELHQIIKFAKQ